MRVLSILSAVFLSFNLIACGGGEAQTDQNQIAKNVNADEFHQLYVAKGGQMLDVRTDGEVAEGYITGAKQIDFYSEDFDQQISQLDKNQPVFVYCAAGGRSGKAMGKLKDLGFNEVYNLAGGYGTWEASGYETSK